MTHNGASSADSIIFRDQDTSEVIIVTNVIPLPLIKDHKRVGCV